LPGIVVIPARGGSQRVPGKNIRALHGIPALVRVINACRESGVAERIVVSTDSSEVADVARSAGAEVPFTRPVDLADGHTPILPVMKHAIRELDLDPGVDVACVYATAVTVDPQNLLAGYRKLRTVADGSFVVSITTFDYPIQRAIQMDADGRIALVDPSQANTRSQDLPERWHDAGQFIWGTAATWLRANTVWDRAIGSPIPHWRTVDIDTEDDWQRAELIIRAHGAILQGDPGGSLA